MNMKGKIITVCLANVLFSLQAAELCQPEGEQKRSEEEQNAILDTIAQINHINWVVNVIKSYDNAVVLEEEYEKISYGNLDLNRIPDEETLGRITKTLDTLHSLRKDEREMKHWREKFRDERMRKIRKYELESARSTYGLFKGSILDVLTGDIGMVAQAVFGIVHGSLSLQYDYEDFIQGLDQEQRDRVFAFDSKKLDLLHQQNKEMLDDQWRLVRKYHLDDKATRVTDVDIRYLLAVLKDGNASRIYVRLIAMKDRYMLFPEYWYYLSCAAFETGHFNKGIEACDAFFKVNRSIFRDDPMVGTVAINKACMLEKSDANKEEIRRCLEIAWKNNVLRADWRISYLAANMYYGLFNEKDKAEMMLEHAVTLVESEIQESQEYNDKADNALAERLYNCRNALHQLRGEPLEKTKWRRMPKTGDTKEITLPGGAKMVMIYVAPGSFVMGSSEIDEKPAHMVTLTKGFWMGKYEVTQAQWKSVMGSINVDHGFLLLVNAPSAPNFLGADRPMDNILWGDCQQFIAKVNEQFRDGVVRLPTEAEWEYACRAGTTGAYSGTGKLDDMGWYTGQFKGIARLLSNEVGEGTHIVGQKTANAWGFCDMHGNVWEWCNDEFGPYPYGEVTDPMGAKDGDGYVRRGGSWSYGAFGCTSSYRNHGFLLDVVNDCGFRLVFTEDSRD